MSEMKNDTIEQNEELHECCGCCKNKESAEECSCQNTGCNCCGEEVIEELPVDETALWQDRAMRALAEIENIKHRAAVDVEKKSKIQLKNFINDMLPVLDNFDRAMEACNTDDECSPEFKNIVVGVQFIYQSALEAFAKHGVKKIETIGAEFDPVKHKAISFEENAKQSGKVIKELQSGYTLGNEILREASVIVGK